MSCQAQVRDSSWEQAPGVFIWHLQEEYSVCKGPGLLRALLLQGRQHPTQCCTVLLLFIGVSELHLLHKAEGESKRCSAGCTEGKAETSCPPGLVLEAFCGL